uniref:proteasome assembly chaperone 2-like n=1 Tax=Ciona intestinalis TaxID=7719 RepID=UPI000EF47073|nr:proteasome assembly chaperone 2-like [Ciona intestinalis]|eukprot:XP_026693861.1 proteasome assembly chaperone 2-like [Ciona intestinalis]
MFYCSKNSKKFSPESSVLILPAISVGNVGQLACDVIIATLQLEKVGYFCPECFLPLVGASAFVGDEKLGLSSEVYHSNEANITVIQFRSPLANGKQLKFCEDFVSWVKQQKFSEVVLLSSCHSFERKDNEIIGSSIRYIASSNHKRPIGWVEMEKRENQLFLPGAGFTKKMFDKCCNEKISILVLLTYCSEGNNIPDAIMLLDQLNQWKPLATTSWKQPISWIHLFGNNAPKGIF